MDIVIHNVDDAIRERLDQVANELGWQTDEVVEQALRYALGLSGESLVRRERRDIARLRGVWNSDETAMFDDALDAFERLDGRPLFSDAEGAGKGSPATTARRKLG
ncbi:MAG: hypothetical protein ABIR62_01255 [Dokdonella sp.]|uniref:hypothetical protein n=1 Tax=Dokdonella sp. TaxID=2291710 RepID=UPI0032649F66